MVICPKCSHVRPKDASNPAWQCPSCGVCYAKAETPAPQRARRDTPQVVVKHSWDLGFLFKIVLLVALGWGLSVALKYRQEKVDAANAAEEAQMVVVEEPKAERGAAVALADAALQVSGADVGMLKDLALKLETSCARNKYGLSESECIDVTRRRGDLCATRTAGQFPGQFGNSERMQVVVQAYVGCIFER